MPWSKRQELIRQAWVVQANRPRGNLLDLTDELRVHVLNSRLHVEDKAVEILVRTLCIAQCFDADDGIPSFHNTQQLVRPAVSVDEALFLMNYTYINGIRLAIPWVPLIEDAVAMLLFDQVTDTTRSEATKLIARVTGGDSGPFSPIAEAFKKAQAAEENSRDGAPI